MLIDQVMLGLQETTSMCLRNKLLYTRSSLNILDMPISSTEFDELQKPVEERILRLYASKGKQVLTTTEIRNEIEMSHQTLLKKLSRLSSDGKIKRTTFPGSRVIFWELLSS